MDARASGRLAKEMQRLQANALRAKPEDALIAEAITEDVWNVSFLGPMGSLYAGEQYTLRIQFVNYPMESPIVTFLTGNVPVHEHIYSNGHICLNVLGDDWSPALTVDGLCRSIQSMLASATEKKKPHDNDKYVRSHPANSNPKKTNFAYHDDKV